MKLTKFTGLTLRLTLIIIILSLMALLITSCNANSANNANKNINNKEDDNMNNMNTIVVMETSKGNIEIELDREHSPISTENFLKYVNDGFYDGLVFHRVIKGFMIQGGGFTSERVQKQPRSPIRLESQNGLLNMKGTVAMARTNIPDSATSQFFINTADNKFLDYAPGNDGYAVFGKVVSGMEIVGLIEDVPTTTKGHYRDWPTEDVIIKKVYVKK